MKLRLAYSADPADALRDPSQRRRDHLELVRSIKTPPRDPADVERERRASELFAALVAIARGTIDDGGKPQGPAMTRATELIREMEIRNLIGDAFNRIAITTPKPATA